MNFLLDTNVLSEMRKPAMAARTKARLDPRVAQWLQSVPASSLHLSVISILEIEIGILLLERRDAAQARILRTWLENRVLSAFRGRIHEIDLAVARHAAPLHVPDPSEDRDALIAATAAVHKMTVVTRNVTHFTPLGVPILNPWER
jgi:predicted nucleic acid-binding protein